MLFALGASHLLRGVLYGLHTMDGISFAGVSLLFLAIALLASYPPSGERCTWIPWWHSGTSRASVPARA
jgi:hypothetical protein